MSVCFINNELHRIISNLNNKGVFKMKEFNFWCKENTDHGECADKVCDYDNCCCYAHCEECIFYLTDSPACENCSVPCYDD